MSPTSVAGPDDSASACRCVLDSCRLSWRERRRGEAGGESAMLSGHGLSGVGSAGGGDCEAHCPSCAGAGRSEAKRGKAKQSKGQTMREAGDCSERSDRRAEAADSGSRCRVEVHARRLWSGIDLDGLCWSDDSEVKDGEGEILTFMQRAAAESSSRQQ